MATKYASSCPCGFTLASHRKGEVVEMTRMHVWGTHRKRVSRAEAAKFVKTRKR